MYMYRHRPYHTVLVDVCRSYRPFYPTVASLLDCHAFAFYVPSVPLQLSHHTFNPSTLYASELRLPSPSVDRAPWCAFSAFPGPSRGDVAWPACRLVGGWTS
jgi:hypothetical protein